MTISSLVHDILPITMNTIKFIARLSSLTALLTSPVVAETTIIASSGDPSPDNNGFYSAAGFNGGTLIDLNESGQVAFTVTLTGTTGGTFDNKAIVRADQSTQEIVIRKGDYMVLHGFRSQLFTGR